MLKDLLDSNGFIALVTSLFGGAGLALVTKYLNRGDTKVTQQSQFSSQQQTEIDSLRNQIIQLKESEAKIDAERDAWQSKYYEVLINKQKVENDLTNSLLELERIKKDLDKLQTAHNNIVGPK